MKAVHTPGLADPYFQALDFDAAVAALARKQAAFDVVTEPSGQRRFWLVCPGPCKSLTAIALRPVVDGSKQSWEMGGDLTAPTLHPSIHHVGCWHGWLTAGEFTSG